MSTVRVSAKEHSINGGSGVGLATGIKVHRNQVLAITVGGEDSWNADVGNGREGNANSLPENTPSIHGGGYFELARGETKWRFPYGFLVGSYDGGNTFFAIGTLHVSTVPVKEGELTLYYWDTNRADNGGEVAVDVRVSGD